MLTSNVHSPYELTYAQSTLITISEELNHNILACIWFGHEVGCVRPILFCGIGWLQLSIWFMVYDGYGFFVW